MTDRPILFSGPMVRAIIEGRKTQTRRVLKPLPRRTIFFNPQTAGAHQFRDPCFAPGDRLWVRETWTARMEHGWTIADARSRMYREEILYKADGDDSIDGWWPSIHMPREFSRLTLIVTDVRVQRLQDITLGDICAEGLAASIYDFKPVQRGFDAFAHLWESLNAKRGAGWDANPWVSAVTFEAHRKNIDRMGRA